MKYYMIIGQHNAADDFLGVEASLEDAKKIVEKFEGDKQLYAAVIELEVSKPLMRNDGRVWKYNPFEKSWDELNQSHIMS